MMSAQINKFTIMCQCKNNSYGRKFWREVLWKFRKVKRKRKKNMKTMRRFLNDTCYKLSYSITKIRLKIKPVEPQWCQSLLSKSPYAKIPFCQIALPSHVISCPKFHLHIPTPCFWALSSSTPMKSDTEYCVFLIVIFTHRIGQRLVWSLL